jgi:alpha-tubulin suppressor-like RCC1 family protein
VALKTSGDVVAWGRNSFGITAVPLAARSGVKAIAAGWVHTVALKSNGMVVAWGDSSLKRGL